ncbi:puromycin-sensitive aminopeptidase-like [Ctenocephalides felis]|uniref:puromycin-sensitive aminopeptidase-like n=1 Tax=Ctenocephalides felis TaxID=7515 RepID=UPI000E6E5B5C|nr:puromycin-sensitive aminopeptidase-like [Ctenocephalides felis]
MAEDSERLSTNVVPEHYVLELDLDPSVSGYTGKVTINLKIKQQTNCVILSCLGINIKKATISHCNGKECSDNISYQEKDERATIQFKKCIPKGNACLILEFGRDFHEISAICKSTFDTCKGTKTYVISHFEPNRAREAFPCFDEPALKATFDIVMKVPENLMALSNMDVREEEVKCGCKTVCFNTTPKMSTYLLAFSVGEFEYIESQTEGGKGLYAPGMKKYGQFGLEVAVKGLDIFSKLFDEPYSLPKLDLVVTKNFASGAMENWGHISFGDMSMIFNKNETPTVWKSSISGTVIHELAHLWFGDLVTMNWWSDLWLNEGFASFYSVLGKYRILPEIDPWNGFLLHFYAAMAADEMPGAAPIVRKVGSTSDAQAMFNASSYSKGATIIRMLRNFMEEEDYTKGIKNYIQKYKFQSAGTADLWKAMEEASGKPIGCMMNAWVNQPGYPLLTVSETHCGTTRTINIKQEVFTKSTGQEVPPMQWTIPITVMTSKCPTGYTVRTLMECQSTSVTVEDLAPCDWVKLNVGTMDYYRVLYPPEMMDKFGPSIESLSMPVLDRIGFVGGYICDGDFWQKDDGDVFPIPVPLQKRRFTIRLGIHWKYFKKNAQFGVQHRIKK